MIKLKKSSSILLVIAVMMIAVGCDTSICAKGIECGLVGQWKSAAEDYEVVEFTAESNIIWKRGEVFIYDNLPCRSTCTATITVYDKDLKEEMDSLSYYFDGADLFLRGTRFIKKN